MKRHVFSKYTKGAAVVEFAIILPVFLGLLFGIVEFGRLFYLWDTAQEVTRHAAREAVVRLGSETGQIARESIFQPGNGSGSVSLPGAWELTNGHVSIKYYKTYVDAAANNNKNEDPPTLDEFANYLTECAGTTPKDPGPGEADDCIRFVRASVSGVQFEPFVFLGGTNSFPFNLNLSWNLPESTVIMPVESLGYVPPP